MIAFCCWKNDKL